MNFEIMSEFGSDLHVLYFAVIVYFQRLIKMLDKRSLY